MDESLRNIIEQVVRAEIAKDLSELLKECLCVLESKNANKREFISVLNERLTNIGGVHRLDTLLSSNTHILQNVYVHDYKVAPVIYVSHRLISSNKIRDYKVTLHKLIDMFDNEFNEPKTVGLKKDQVNNVLHFLQSEYRIFDIITCKTDLEIFLFNNSHKQFNSFCEVFYDEKEPETYHKRFIFTFASRSEEHDPYQVLIHEIGHALQVALTHQGMMTPDSFIEMNKELDVYLENNTVVSAEVFADIFSVVVMNNSYFAVHNDLIRIFPPEVLDLFKCYFKMLFEYALENKEVLKTKKLDIIWANSGKPPKS
ncbi:hypothetical protein [Desulfosporosinus sp. FKB]|uniref:hypothetical protein n=1 Tax=Desulfosporosinus sp. FKB TaxID=1969835 RepID=UPI000B49F931|nr:hypothetical protein [Desulfosporosinus sp. FKB]